MEYCGKYLVQQGIRNLLFEIFACYRSKLNYLVVRDPLAVLEKNIFPGIHMAIFGIWHRIQINNYKKTIWEVEKKQQKYNSF